MAGSREDPVELGSDMDEDEALRYAIALSLQEQEVQGEQSSQIPSASTSTSHRNGTGSGGASLGLLSLDRKKMEEERLQRLAKRRRSPEDAGNVGEVPPAKRMAPSEPSRTVTATATAPELPSLVSYPKGAIKRTWAKGYPRTSDDIKIEEVFQKDKLELALLSSYQWDDEWLMSKIDTRKTKLMLLAFADSEAQKSEMRSNAPPGIKFVFPAMNGPGAMHSKLQLLKYPGYLRVVVPTANLVPYDWGETGVMENMVFLIDLPRLKDSLTYRPTDFSTELGRFLSASGVGEGMHLGFVYTIPGGHQGDSLKRIGYSGLGTTVAALGLATDEPIEVDFVVGRTGAASKNKASNPWQEKLKDRFRIYFPTDETVVRSRGGRNAAGTICVQPKWWRSPTFPTELVRDCVNTRDGLLMHSKMIMVSQTQAGSQLQTRPQTRPEPRHHNSGPASSSTAEPKTEEMSLGWVYIGSANLSESAWGRIVKDRATGQPKMSCRNWESGVVVRISNPKNSSTVSASFSTSASASAGASSSTKVKAAEGQARSSVRAGKISGEPDKGCVTSQHNHYHYQMQKQKQKQEEGLTDTDAKADSDMMSGTVFEGTVPIPMRRPGRRYREGEEPWFYSVQG
ncbi:tyrosyl-DNA phosphodiesterase-domain-containing protein [Fusarium redolens]|uniref:Tyrosyl-DNA phosphodiesterase-domain-containing protein n=1 Tax=Fusarium redolens TaxID=48865 RepID=A0A9P9GRB5_FUSRE|nr:tyrosyl-DNA phosphodiesterase-domain-containing protein [Fusarium redolens]KAH7244264.1 tyrosyl-DNA phosphodiesterase-domain-containing protein [Fusarium redolens]